MGKRLKTERDWPGLGKRMALAHGSGHIPTAKPLPLVIQTCKVKRGMSQYTKMMRRLDKAKGRKQKQPVNLVSMGLFRFYTTK